MFCERVEWWDVAAVAQVFRELVFAELVVAERLRPETAEMMRSWQHSAFDVHASEPVLPTDRERLEKIELRRAGADRTGLDAAAGRQPRPRADAAPSADGRDALGVRVLEMVRRMCVLEFPRSRRHLEGGF